MRLFLIVVSSRGRRSPQGEFIGCVFKRKKNLVREFIGCVFKRKKNLVREFIGSLQEEDTSRRRESS